MKKIVLQLVILVLFALGACNKHTADILVSPSAARDTDTALVRLSRMDVSNLPSPYYRFVYNDSGYVTSVQFASGFFRYELQYAGRRLKKMTNIVDGSFLFYTYRAGHVTDVDLFDGASNERSGHYDLTYDAAGKLTVLEYAEFDNNGADSIPARRFEFSYRPDGNLERYKSFWRDNSGQLAWSTTTGFNNYDNGQNVDDFGLFKEFFEHFLFLPAVKLMKNNPGVSNIVGVTNDYEISYSFSYTNKLPVLKKTTIKQTRGSDAGHVVTGQTQYTY